ncbi:FecR domain-containing protein [Parahaliea mediterranea]|uniref:FecR domain-containing protein n=1 Tax=Parahaliea mediterranea TaxID=651086 RepID=UPI000E2EAA40|nr:FecR domain-containing protein [Parahaliea mediterranea]
MRLRAFLPGIAGLALCALATHAVAGDWLYFAKQGDTAWDLCQKYTSKNGCWIELIKYNNISNDREIPVGTKIRIPAQWISRPIVVGTVLSVNGDVQVQRNNTDTESLSTGANLLLGDVIIATEGSARIRLGADNSLLIRPNSTLRLENLSEHTSPRQANELRLPRGKVEVDVVPGRGTLFEIGTPSAVAAVRGTRYRVISDDSTQVETLAGAVAVASGESSLVAAGQGIKVARDGRAGPAIALPPAPVLSSTRYAGRLPIQVDWTPVDGINAWNIDLFSQASNGALTHTLNGEGAQATISGLNEGCYSAQASLISSEGFRGPTTDLEICVEPGLGPIERLTIDKISDASGKDKRRISWAPLEDAVEYRVEIASDANFASNLVTRSVRDTAITVHDLPRGKLYVRVTPIDNKGYSGQKAEPTAFNYWDITGASLFFAALALLLLL